MLKRVLFFLSVLLIYYCGASYDAVIEQAPYTNAVVNPYNPYSPYDPYNPCSPDLPYYNPYNPYNPYQPYGPYSPRHPYGPYQPYSPCRSHGLLPDSAPLDSSEVQVVE